MITPKDIRHRRGKTEFVYNELIGRKRHDTYVFLDYIFVNEEKDFLGAVGTSIVPVSEAELNERLDELRDYEWSSLGHIYDECNTDMSWDEWIEQQIRYDGWDLVYDPSYAGSYGEIAVEKYLSENEYDEEKYGDLWSECIGGGRMFNNVDGYDVVYNPELLELIKKVEAGIVPTELM